MSQSAAQWARSQIESGESEDKIITFEMWGIKHQMPLWDMASMADASDVLDKQCAEMLGMSH